MAQTYLDGRITFPSDRQVSTLAIAVNGTVAGTAAVIGDGEGTGTFHGMIAEELIDDGPNQIDVLVPDGSGTWLSGTAADLTIELHAPDGRVLELGPEGGRRIQVDRVELGGSGSLRVVGWAADVGAKVPPETIYLFAGDQLLASGPPNLDNGNVVAWFGSEDLRRSGFDFTVTAVPDGAAQLTVVAEFGSHAVAETVPVPTD